MDDTTNVYRLRFTGLGWGTETPTFNVEIFDSVDMPLFSATGLSFYQNGAPIVGGARQVEFTTDFGGNGFWIDEACVSSLEALPPMEDLVLTSVARTGDDITLNWNDLGPFAHSVERSFDGQNFTTIVTGVMGTTYTDVGVIAANPDEDQVVYRVFIP